MSQTGEAPAFVTKVGTGMAEAAAEDQPEVRAAALPRDDAKQLAEQIEDIAQARMRARAASRHAFVG